MALMKLLRLPVEILSQILLQLDVKDLLRCTRTNQFFKDLYESSSAMKYSVALHLSGTQDDPYCKLSINRKLRRLESYMRRWNSLEYQRENKVKVRHDGSAAYDLSGDIFFLGDNEGHKDANLTYTLRYVDLSVFRNSVGEHDQWPKIDVDGDIKDIGASLAENDLLALVTTKLVPLSYTESSST